MLVSFFIIVAGMAATGWWVGMQIESGVVHQTASNTALYVTSVVEPNLQEIASGGALAPQHTALLERLLQDNGLGQHITEVKVWDKSGRVIYATDPANVGQVFPIDAELARALHGWVASDITVLDQPENANDRNRGQRHLATYSPVRRAGSDEVIAAVEFYQTVESLDRDIASAQRSSWLVVGAAAGLMYLLLAGFVGRASDTIQRQQNELSSQVVQLRAVLKQNEQLHDRVRRAARRTTALNERFLRRISAELHDGPAQDLGLALLRLEHLLPQTRRVGAGNPTDADPQADFTLIQTSLSHALGEIRAISSGLGLPELENITLAETAARAVRAHERRTGGRVDFLSSGLPPNAPLPVKITVYRIIQEALTNAYRHAGDLHPGVRVEYARGQLSINIKDSGPGFDETHAAEWNEHLGLAGMRERVESLGGLFRVESALGQGTRVLAHIPLDPQ